MANSATKSFFGGITGTLGVFVGLFLILCLCCTSIGIIAALGSDSNKDSSADNTNTEQQQEQPANEENSQASEPPAAPAAPTVLDVEINSFVAEFDANQLAAEKKYEGKTIKFTGYIDNISEDILGDSYVIVKPTNDQYYFGTSIQCYFDNTDQLLSLSNESMVTMQGEFDTQSFNILVKKCSVVN